MDQEIHNVLTDMKKILENTEKRCNNINRYSNFSSFYFLFVPQKCNINDFIRLFYVQTLEQDTRIEKKATKIAEQLNKKCSPYKQIYIYIGIHEIIYTHIFDLRWCSRSGNILVAAIKTRGCNGINISKKKGLFLSGWQPSEGTSRLQNIHRMYEMLTPLGIFGGPIENRHKNPSVL